MLPDCFCQVSNLKDAFNYVRVSASPKQLLRILIFDFPKKISGHRVIHVKICCKLPKPIIKPTTIYPWKRMSSLHSASSTTRKGQTPCMTNRGRCQSASQIMEAEIVGGRSKVSVFQWLVTVFVSAVFGVSFFPSFFACQN